MLEILKTLQLSEKESEVLMALYELGKASPAELAQKTGLNRSTVYVVLNELQNRMFVREDVSSKKYNYIAIHPDELENMKPLLKEEYEQKSAALDAFIVNIKTSMNEKSIHVPKVLFVPEEQMKKHLMTRTPIWDKSMSDTQTDYVGYSDYTFVEAYEEFIDWYWKQPSAKNITLRILTNETEYEEQAMKPKTPERRQIRYWNDAGEITFSTWVNGDYVILSQTREHPYYLIEIYDTAFARSQRQIFESMWGHTEK